jgi:TonB family protein
MRRNAWIAILFVASLGFGLQASNPSDVKPARLVREVKPVYPARAKALGIQGTVVLTALINDQGRVEQVEILSPLGYGFDEAARDAVLQWQYQPTTWKGEPVTVVTEITVNFQLTRSQFDRKLEAQRTAYNVALSQLQKGGTNGPVAALQKLCSDNYSPAQYLYGTMLEQGRGVPADADQGFRLIEAAADEQFGPAMYQVAIARLQGRRLQKDPAAGMQLMEGAAQMGSVPAQAYMGQAYEKGDGVPVDLEKSSQNYRLCAATGDGLCQYHLGKSILEDAEHLKRNYVQAIAWLELASDKGVEEAKQALQQEAARLTPAQTLQANELKTRLVHKL